MEVLPKRSKVVKKGCLGNVNDGEKDVEQLRTLFDEIVSILVKDSSGDGKVDPFPPLLRDGRSVDLFTLYVAVRARGGFKYVSKKGKWDSVAVELELEHGLKLGLKAIFKKYLNDLDSRVCEIVNWKGCRIMEGNTIMNLNKLNSKAVEERSEGVKLDDKLRRKYADITRLEPDDNDVDVLPEAKKNDLDSKIINFARNFFQLMITRRARVNTDFPDNAKNGVNSKSVAVNLSAGSRKRKRESVHAMLKWVSEVAKFPMKAAADINQKGSGYYAQSLLARQFLFVNGSDGGKETSIVQNSMKSMPSYYDDATCLNNQSTGILRCSKRVSSKSFFKGNGKLRDSEHFNFNPKTCFEMDIENDEGPLKSFPFMEDSVDTVCHSPLIANHSWIDDLPVEKHTSVGPKYQVKVPEWTGLVNESDSKWLGTRMWPLEKEEANSALSLIPDGRERPDSCSCRIPGSVTCTRFHIAEKKLVLKRELGSLFYLWKFNKMGEDYALGWRNKEESRFMQMVRRNPPSAGKSFWRCAPRYLRRKTRYMVVSYYFNVFVLRRRMYQNRVTPNEIDSDDDDKEFEMLGDV